MNLAALNLGEVLRGSRIFDTPYKFNMSIDQVILKFLLYESELQVSKLFYWF